MSYLARGGIVLLAAGALVIPAALVSPAGAGGTPGAPVLDPGQPAPAPPGARPDAVPAGSKPTVYYYNWSGYAAQTAKPFTEVESTYVQPKVTCPVTSAYTVFWVGFDGFSNSTVEQDGTLANCAGTSTPKYQAWWEMYPTYDIQPTFTVAPGDTIKAVVTYQSNGDYVMTVDDVTSGKHVTKTKTCAKGLTCARNSAEWIVERPGYGGENYTPLADWGKMAVSGDQAAAGGALSPVTSFSYTPIDMVNKKDTYYLALVGSLNAAGRSFPDTWAADQ